MAKLTAKQLRFAEEYLIDLNATQAYHRAGYKAKGNAAEVNAARLLRKAQVQEAIQAGKSKRSEQTKIDSNYVLNRLVEIDQMDVLDILDEEGNMLPVSNWPKVWRTTLSGLDINRIRSIGNDEESVESVLQKIKWPDKVKNLELIGKHVVVQAWREQLGVGDPNGNPVAMPTTIQLVAPNGDSKP